MLANGADMDPSATPTGQAQESAIHRAQMQMAIAEMRKDLDKHFHDDELALGGITSKMEILLTLKTQIRLLTAIVLLVGGGMTLIGRWTISHAISDALIEQGIIHYERTAP